MASPVSELLSICNEIRKNASQLVASREAQGSQSEKTVQEGTLLLLGLKDLNREAYTLVDDVKTETNNSKQALDQTNLQLQNKLYEKHHYMKEIQACQSFRTAYQDIDLAPVEEFARDAPEELKGASLASGDPHKLMLARLTYELQQRKSLCARLAELKARRAALVDGIGAKRRFHEALPGQLKALKKATAPMQQELGMPISAAAKSQRLAELLPSPLFILYSQLLAYKEAIGATAGTPPSSSSPSPQPPLILDVTIEGRMSDARAFAAAQLKQGAAAGKGEGGGEQDSGAVDAIDDSTAPADAAMEEDDDEAQPRKRSKRGGHRTSAAPEGGSGEDGVAIGVGGDKAGEEKTGAGAAVTVSGGEHRRYAKHPLSVSLVISRPPLPGRKALTVRFEYLVALRLVTACASAHVEGGSIVSPFTSEQLLANVFPDDAGLDTPNLMNAYLDAGGFRYDPSRAERPYRWAQHLGGMDFLPDVPPLLRRHLALQADQDNALAGSAAVPHADKSGSDDTSAMDVSHAGNSGPLGGTAGGGVPVGVGVTEGGSGGSVGGTGDAAVLAGLSEHRRQQRVKGIVHALFARVSALDALRWMGAASGTICFVNYGYVSMCV
eukprot:jgi/Mesvir1/1434/Mv14429-RA.1